MPRRPSMSASVQSATSPSSVGSSTVQESSGMTQQNVELQKKRARDRKSQQAMRDRNKWTIQNLNDQIAYLNSAMEERSQDVAMLQTRIGVLESENAQLRAQNAALQLSLMGRNDNSGPGDDSFVFERRLSDSPWELPSRNTAPGCIADQVLQGFVDSVRSGSILTSTSSYTLKPKLSALVQQQGRSEDDISNVVADVVRTYPEIETLPKQVAVFQNMALLLKWMVLLDKQSWDLMPSWLRPVPAQLTTPHAAWIDRIPWPRVREYLIANPDITLDDWAATYSSSFDVSWTYEPSLVLITVATDGPEMSEITINPVYEEHLRQLKNWTVGRLFRQRLPEIADLIDRDTLENGVCGEFNTS
ncbi:BZIP transcription factor [Colletotrichum gloeosporioides Cg-14]|uniref:BZIP transcription factor n=1 Tax=Colletotrichum gloeosporioides (strain Cg-14) TaxID=1237896 RepID=T0KM15_COLGC|nr:BZIP transcription factor [Colletotrichum gloeosporioides Cg-14]